MVQLRLADEVAEWLRRQTANLLCSARVSSNLILVGIFNGLMWNNYKIIAAAIMIRLCDIFYLSLVRWINWTFTSKQEKNAVCFGNLQSTEQSW